MSDPERAKLLEALRGPIEYRTDPVAQRIMDECAAEDLRAIEPVLTEMLRNAEAKARFELWLEVGDRNLRRAVAQEPTGSDLHAPAEPSGRAALRKNGVAGSDVVDGQ